MEPGSETQEQRDQIVRSVTQGMQGGSQAAFTRFYNMVYDGTYRMLLARTRGDEDLARELVQAVMIRAARHVHSFENERMLWGWLRQVARSCHVDWLRKKGREPQCVSLEFYSEVNAQEGSGDGDELFAALERSISELDADEREVLHLAYFEAVPHQSMAAKLQTSAKAIESRLGRIRQKLRRILLEKMKDYALL
jgi:RNA polymerase sigma-70 factor (ECF subfamily)